MRTVEVTISVRAQSGSRTSFSTPHELVQPPPRSLQLLDLPCQHEPYPLELLCWTHRRDSPAGMSTRSGTQCCARAVSTGNA